MTEKAVISIKTMPAPINEAETYLKAQAELFFGWINEFSDGGENTKVNMKFWFDEFSRLQKYNRREKKYIQEMVIKELQLRKFKNKKIFKEQFQ